MILLPIHCLWGEWGARGLHTSQAVRKALLTASSSEAISLNHISLGAFGCLVFALRSGPGARWGLSPLPAACSVLVQSHQQPEQGCDSATLSLAPPGKSTELSLFCPPGSNHPPIPRRGLSRPGRPQGVCTGRAKATWECEVLDPKVGDASRTGLPFPRFHLLSVCLLYSGLTAGSSFSIPLPLSFLLPILSVNFY